MGPPRGALFTDLDGTLLDFATYRPSAEALAVIENLARANILTILVSSKTAAEMRPLLLELDLPGPAVAEGGAVVVGVDGNQIVVGPSRSKLIEVLARLAEAGWPVRGLSAMNLGEVSKITGLDAEGACRAQDRVASEPFLVTRPLAESEIAELEAAVAALGAATIRGGRFWHLMGAGVDKASGMRRALQMIGGEGVPTAAVGDAWNDLPMLVAADLGFLLGEKVNGPSIPDGVIRLREDGPSGFVAAARRVLGAWEA